MAVTVVTNQEDSFADYTGSTYPTVTLTFPGNWTVGNGILASISWVPTAAQTVSSVDAGSNSAVASNEFNDGDVNIRQFVIKNLSGTPGATVVFTFSAATGSIVAHACEVTGQDTATQPDAASVGQGQSGLSGTANAVSSGSITTASANAFLYGLSVINTTGTMTAIDEGTGFTAFPDITGLGGSISQLGLAEYATRAVAGAGDVTYTATGATGGTNLLTIAFAIKAAAASFIDFCTGSDDMSDCGDM
jgi:hypothetical protein